MVDQETKLAVSVIGLGAMGSTLARTMLLHGHEVTVWNRSPARAQSCREAGAKVSESLDEAIMASTLIIVCTIDKCVALDLPGKPAIAPLLNGKTIVNFSTGSAEEARSIAAHVSVYGGEYIDGGIMAYPRDIGKTETLMLYGGNAAAFDTYCHTLSTLGGCMRSWAKIPGRYLTST